MQEYRRRRVPSPYDENPRNMSGGSRFFATAFLAILVASAYAYFTVSNYGDTLLPKSGFSISKGESLASLPKKLKLDDWRAKWYVKYFAPPVEKLQIGTYAVPEGAKFSEVFSKVLKKPDTKDLTVTVLPGWTAFDVDAYFADLGISRP